MALCSPSFSLRGGPVALLVTAALSLAACGGGDGPTGASLTESGYRFAASVDTLLVGQSKAIGLTLTDRKGRPVNAAKVAWTSSAPSVVAVTTSGVAVGVAPGTADVTAASGSLSASLRVVVRLVPVSSVTFESAPAQLVNGAVVQLVASARDSAGGVLNGRTVTFRSSNSAVVEISSGGLARAGASGTVTITAESEGRAGTLTVTVVSVPVASVTLQPSSLTIEAGRWGQLAALPKDASGNVLPGRSVTYRSTNVSVASVDGNGTVQAISVGSAAIIADVEGRIATAPVTVVAPGTPAPSPGVQPPASVPAPPLPTTGGDGSYRIDTRFVGTADSRATAVIGQAVARWQAAISGDLPNVSADIPANACGVQGLPASHETIDDMLIYVRVTDIDGVGKVLARAGPCYVRSGGGLPVIGVIELDQADLGRNPQTVLDVVTHEMGHVLGIGTMWDLRKLVYGAGGGDPLFVGETAQTAFRALGMGAAFVPVENTGGSGTRDSHWRETSFGAELMTGWINTGANPMSAVTISSLRDMGYAVNLGAAEGYALPSLAVPGSGVTARVVAPAGLEMQDELYRPTFEITPEGRTRRLP